MTADTVIEYARNVYPRALVAALEPEIVQGLRARSESYEPDGRDAEISGVAPYTGDTDRPWRVIAQNCRKGW